MCVSVYVCALGRQVYSFVIMYRFNNHYHQDVHTCNPRSWNAQRELQNCRLEANQS